MTTTTADELVKDRTKGLGGSDMAPLVMGPVFGRTVLSTYYEKIGEAPPRNPSEIMHWGNVLEEPVAREYSRRTGNKIRRVNKTLRDKERPYLMAHIDRKVVGTHDNRILEVKTTGRTDGWGAEGTDQIPNNYMVQVQHYMGVTGAEVADVAVLIRGQKFRIYEVVRNEELIEILRRAGEEFWIKHVEPRIPPDPETLEDCALLWRDHRDGKVVEASGDLVATLKALSDSRAAMQYAKERINDIELELKTRMEDADSIVAPSGDVLVTWKTTARSTVSVKDMPKEVREKYLKSSTIRVFRPNWKKLEVLSNV